MQLSIALACLLALFSAAVWGRYVAAQEAEEAQGDEEAELLRPEANWSTAQRVSTTSDVNGAFVPAIRASSTERLMIMYNYETDGGAENPFYTQSVDGGDTWSAPAPVHASDTSAVQVAFDFSGNTAHAVWRTADSVWHAREDQWATNGSTLIVDADEIVFDPEIAAAPGGVLHVIWTQQDHKLYYAISRNGGDTWSSPQELTTGQNRANVPDIAVDQNGDAHVVWEERIFDGSPWRYEIRYRKGTVTPSAVNWDSYLVLATSLGQEELGEPRQPAIATDGGDLHVGFSRRLESDEQYPYYIGYTPTNGWDAESTNTSPGNPVEVNTNTPFYLVSTVAGCSNGVHLYYHGAVDPNPREQVLGTTHEGSWSPRAVVTDPGERSINPSMVCTGATAHLVYALILTVNDNHQIYYTRLSPTIFMPTVHKS